MKLRITYNKFLLVLLIIILIIDIIFTVTSPAYQEYNRLIKEVDNAYINNCEKIKKEIITLVEPVYNAHTNFNHSLEKLKQFYSGTETFNTSCTINDSKKITDSIITNRVSVTDYKYGSYNSVPHFTIGSDLYYVGDNYLGETISYIDRWGFATDKTLYYKTESEKKEIIKKKENK